MNKLPEALEKIHEIEDLRNLLYRIQVKLSKIQFYIQIKSSKEIADFFENSRKTND